MEIGTVVAICLFIFILVLGLGMLVYFYEKRKWNQGFCSSCGEEWDKLPEARCGRQYVCKNLHTAKIHWKSIDLG